MLTSKSKYLYMKKNHDLSLLILRIVFSLAIISHGYGKLLNVVNGDFDYNPLGIGGALTMIIAALGEFVAPIFVILGVKVRLAALVSFIVMFGITFVMHAFKGDPFDDWELPLLYTIGFLVVAISGGGKYVVTEVRKLF